MRLIVIALCTDLWWQQAIIIPMVFPSLDRITAWTPIMFGFWILFWLLLIKLLSLYELNQPTLSFFVKKILNLPALLLIKPSTTWLSVQKYSWILIKIATYLVSIIETFKDETASVSSDLGIVVNLVYRVLDLVITKIQCIFMHQSHLWCLTISVSARTWKVLWHTAVYVLKSCWFGVPHQFS